MGGGSEISKKTGFYVINWRQVHFICLELFKSSRNKIILSLGHCFAKINKQGGF